MGKPILVLDFDGVIHSYTSGWKGETVIPDPPVPGAMDFIWKAADLFRVNIYSSRSKDSAGIVAMKVWLQHHFREFWQADRTACDDILAEIEWPRTKPAAFLTIDDRALQFNGDWSKFEPIQLLEFRPWMKM